MSKAVIFDLDMCIFDTRSLGATILDPVLSPLTSSSLPQDVQQEIRRVLWTTSLEDTIVLFGIPPRTADAMRAAHKLLVVPDSICTFGDEELIEDVEAYRVLVTSGYRKWQEDKIERLGVAKFFDEVFVDAIDNLDLRKGKKQIFRELMARHGWQSSDVVVVGDNPYSELKAGKELGMCTIQTLRPSIQKADGFDHYVSSFRELVSLLGREH